METYYLNETLILLYYNYYVCDLENNYKPKYLLVLVI